MPKTKLHTEALLARVLAATFGLLLSLPCDAYTTSLHSGLLHECQDRLSLACSRRFGHASNKAPVGTQAMAIAAHLAREQPFGSTKAAVHNCSKSTGGCATSNTSPAQAPNFVQPLLQPAAESPVSNVTNAHYVTASWGWAQAPSDNLERPGNNTIHLSPCPLGIDTSNNAKAQYAVYLAGTGTAEAAPVTGGSCATDKKAGTITVFTAYPHRGGYIVGSASSGIQEAINDSGTQRSTIYLLPTDGAKPNYKVYWPVFLNTRSTLLSGYGSLVQCFTRAACIVDGNYLGTNGQSNTIEGIEFMPGLNIDGVQITSVSAANGAYTITTSSNHAFVVGDYVTLFYSNASQSQEGRFKVTSVPAANQFTYSVGRTTILSEPSFGWAAIENTAIEDDADHVTLRDIKFKSGMNQYFHWGIVVGNDQSFKLDGMEGGGSGVIRCTSNFCGALIYGRGDQGMAPVMSIDHLEASMQCMGNGVRYASGNTLHITNSVVQGFNQYGIYYAGGLQSLMIGGTYEESTGTCKNHAYPGSIAAAAGIITNNDLTYLGDDPIGGYFPSFVAQNPGSQVNNYYVVIHSSTAGHMGMYYIGSCSTDGTGNCTTYWPEINLDGLGTVTYDELKTVGEKAIPPNGTGSYAVATGISGSCDSAGICMNVDAQTETRRYTVRTLQRSPQMNFWPGAVILGRGSRLHIADCWQAAGIISTTYLPSVYCNHSSPGRGGQYTPYWAVYQQGDSIGNNNPSIGAILEQAGPATGSSVSGVSGLRGFLNPGSLGQTDMYTFSYTNPFLALATPGYRSAANPTDTAIGFDSMPATPPVAAQLGLRAPVAISEYIGSVFDNKQYKERLTATGKTFNVPVTINGDLTVKGKCLGCSAVPPSASGPTHVVISMIGQSAAIASGVLCPSSACGIGLYRITYYLDAESACPAQGQAVVSLSLSWKDETARRIMDVSLAGMGVSDKGLHLGATSNFGSGVISVWSNGDADLAYSTAYRACDSGSATYSLRIEAEKLP